MGSNPTKNQQLKEMTSLMQWNCQGILTKWEELQHDMASFNPVCLCLQEITTKESNKLYEDTKVMSSTAPLITVLMAELQFLISPFLCSRHCRLRL